MFGMKKNDINNLLPLSELSQSSIRKGMNRFSYLVKTGFVWLGTYDPFNISIDYDQNLFILGNAGPPEPESGCISQDKVELILCNDEYHKECLEAKKKAFSKKYKNVSGSKPQSIKPNYDHIKIFGEKA
jgi:hypothetical protein